MIKYPEVEVRLIGQDGDAYSILGRVSQALRRAGIDRETVNEYIKEATSGDYTKLLYTTMNWVTCDPVSDDDERSEYDYCYWCDELHQYCECDEDEEDDDLD